MKTKIIELLYRLLDRLEDAPTRDEEYIFDSLYGENEHVGDRHLGGSYVLPGGRTVVLFTADGPKSRQRNRVIYDAGTAILRAPSSQVDE